MMKSCSEQKMEFEKFIFFFIEFLRSSFGRIFVLHTNWLVYMIRGFIERYFL